MRLWEIAGWLLLVVGLYVLFQCFVLLVDEPPRIVPAGPLMIIGIFIFRGGIHLLKVAAAARVCRGLSEQFLAPGPAAKARKTSFTPRPSSPVPLYPSTAVKSERL
jgi:hypothetical protein